jgi:hypothetical protein
MFPEPAATIISRALETEDELRQRGGATGQTVMQTFMVEVSLPEELRERFDARVREHGGDQGEYVREVLERDLRTEVPHVGMTFREILAPAQAGFVAAGMTDEELSEFVEAEVREYRAERRARESGGR